MPIIHDVEVETISDEDFYRIDHQVMGLAFSIHGDMGRFWIEISHGSHVLGTQKIDTLNSEVAFKISSITKGEAFYENHLRRFVRFAPVKVMQWINFNHHRIVFKTILP